MRGSVGVRTQLIKLGRTDLEKRRRYYQSLKKHPRKKIISTFNGVYTK